MVRVTGAGNEQETAPGARGVRLGGDRVGRPRRFRDPLSFGDLRGLVVRQVAEVVAGLSEAGRILAVQGTACADEAVILLPAP